jgi:vacuolar protein sorting-associated protein 54
LFILFCVLRLTLLSQCSAALAKNLRSLSHAAFLALARQSFARLYACVDMVDMYSTELLKLVEEATRQVRNDRKTNATAKEVAALSDPDSTLPADLADVVYSAAETANARFSKVIAVRADAHASLSLSEFVEIFAETWSFVIKCETLCRRMIVGLRGAMVSQVSVLALPFSVVVRAQMSVSDRRNCFFNLSISVA